MQRLEGVVWKIKRDRGFAFVKSGGVDYFLHCSALGIGAFDELVDGTRVSFVPIDNGRGPRAEDVQLVG